MPAQKRSAKPLRDRRPPLAAAAALSAKVRDEVRFLRNWVERPLLTGAVVPSGPMLARLMAAYVDPASTGPVVELGPGTGVVTRALLDHGIAPERLVSIEFNPDFCKLLRQRFPQVGIVEGDAYDLSRTLDRVGLSGEPLAGVVSSLPLFTKPLPQRTALITTALGRLAPGAPFVQFSYALVPPVPPGHGDFTLEKSSWVMMNLPPARVWVYRRRARR